MNNCTLVRMLADMSDGQLFTPSGDDELLISVYARQARTLDDLPYTDQFERIYDALSDDGRPTRAELLHRLHNLRKAGRLPRLGRATQLPPRIDAAAEQLLVRLVEQHIGRLGLRDQLPYTDMFDQIVAAFNTHGDLTLSPHDVWRIVAKLAK